MSKWNSIQISHGMQSHEVVLVVCVWCRREDMKTFSLYHTLACVCVIFVCFSMDRY